MGRLPAVHATAMPDAPEQQQIVDRPTAAAIFLVLTVAAGAEDAVRDVLAGAGGLRRSVGFRAPEARLTCVVGIGSDCWDRLYGAPRPAGLHRFVPLDGPVHTAPSTPGDLLLHIRAERADLCFELAQHFTEALGDAATVVDEVHGFKSFDERDLLGFVDGTENPEGAGAFDAVTVGDEDPGFAGGSYVIVQKYLHDLSAWDALTVEQQERAIGRTKLADIEIDDDDKAPDAHIALNVIEDADGNQIDIMRFNMPFGAVGVREFGTYFIGYASAPDVIEQMLSNMFLGTDDAAHDRILDFSTATTGCLFFAPTVDLLENPPEPGTQDSAGAVDAVAAAPASSDGSLGLGSLRGCDR
ncbi:MAG TPA: Dyp-type peroxidase [Solirubrobacteraceae bacterium]|nr:Dyp-type peroxidase [Solirubrobacteraceae bacterium]